MNANSVVPDPTLVEENCILFKLAIVLTVKNMSTKRALSSDFLICIVIVLRKGIQNFLFRLHPASLKGHRSQLVATLIFWEDLIQTINEGVEMVRLEA
jgi:hypothetical protein